MVSDFKNRKDQFYTTRDEEEREKDRRIIMTVSLNKKEDRILSYEQLKESMKTLRQPKDSTALKQLASIGYFVLHDQKTGLALRTVLGNVERNTRMGITMYEDENSANVTQKNEEK